MLNNVVLMGRLTASPELKQTLNGVNVTSFTLAVDRRFQSKEGQKQTDFINCVAWRGKAEFISKYFSKGDPIAITGEIQTRKYQDKDGNPRIAFEIIVNEATFCGSKSGDNAAQPPGASTPTANIPDDDFTLLDNDDELPF